MDCQEQKKKLRKVFSKEKSEEILEGTPDRTAGGIKELMGKFWCNPEEISCVDHLEFLGTSERITFGSPRGIPKHGLGEITEHTCGTYRTPVEPTKKSKELLNKFSIDFSKKFLV